MPLYAATIFLAAFLLFQVEPLIAKIILPWFGGSAAVWSAALLFFQIVLLAGYAYAHALVRFARPRAQVGIHALLLGASCALLPILPPAWLKPSDASEPALRILATLAVTVGLPYFLLSATSPLLQAWYVRQRDRAVPYRLFALSNFGSLLALLSFPFLVEPWLTSRQQALSWSGGYVAFVLLCVTVAWVSRRDGIVREPAASRGAPADRPGIGTIVFWVATAACASTLLIATTHHMSQDIAPIPLLWVVPLAAYLATFIFAFESDRVYQRWVFLPLLALALGTMTYFMWAGSPSKKLLALFAGGLFVCCMVCHGELARRRPAPRYLTLFYLMVALGGAVGGLFVVLVAPRVFDTYLELPIGIVGCAVIGVIVAWRIELPDIGLWPLRALLVAAAIVLTGYIVREERLGRQGYRLLARNFYGVLEVKDDPPNLGYRVRTLYNGAIVHGSQLLDSASRYESTDYYGPKSGVGRALQALEAGRPIRVGSIGLGAGVLTSYGRAGDVYRIYDINPLVPRIAETEFSFYPHLAADKQILLGDARLTLERQDNQDFDLLSVDAFTGDAIPVHLLTNEAIALYFRHLKPDGILALHISNRYLDLAPVCARGAESVGKHAVVVDDDGASAPYFSASTWVLVTADTTWFQAPSFQGATMSPARAPVGFQAWTDGFSNVFQSMKLK